MDFESWNITDLQGFLKERGVAYSKTKKHELVDLCRLAVENNIEVNPNFFKDNIIDELKFKLKYCAGIEFATRNQFCILAKQI